MLYRLCSVYAPPPPFEILLKPPGVFPLCFEHLHTAIHKAGKSCCLEDKVGCGWAREKRLPKDTHEITAKLKTEVALPVSFDTGSKFPNRCPRHIPIHSLGKEAGRNTYKFEQEGILSQRPNAASEAQHKHHPSDHKEEPDRVKATQVCDGGQIGKHALEMGRGRLGGGETD